MKTNIVIPTYNEKDNLAKLVSAIFALKIEDLYIIIVDDNSPDGTGKIADNLSTEFPLAVIHREGKLGLGSAYIAGFKKALANNSELIFEMDADFSHDPQDIPLLISAIKNGADVAIGSRRIKGGNVKGWNWLRNLESISAMTFARIILNLKTKDITAGFRCYRSTVLENINFNKIKSNGYAFQEEMIYICEKKGFKIKEVPVTFVDRVEGHSKLGWRDIFEFFITILRLRFRHYEK